jgi:hypothetical protein
MEHAKPAQKETFKSESSIFAHENSYPKANQLQFPTWALLAILIGAFFILKPFIYISDKKRHGK